MKLWKGRFQKEADPKTNDFNSSISIDSRMYREDIEGSMAHATMLGACGIIEKGESEKIVEGLQGILADLDSGALMIDPDGGAHRPHRRRGQAPAHRPQPQRPGRFGCAPDLAQGLRRRPGPAEGLCESAVP